MCGIFGAISNQVVLEKKLNVLAMCSRRRGFDSSGIVYFNENEKEYEIIRADYDITKLLKKRNWRNSKVIMGHSRLITNGLLDNQPVVRDGLCLIHNGIIINEEELWNSIDIERKFEVDSEVIIAVALEYLEKGNPVEGLSKYILSRCKGNISAALAIPSKGKLILFSNNGSLYVGEMQNDLYFASEEHILKKVGCTKTTQILEESKIIDIPETTELNLKDEVERRTENLIPRLKNIAKEESMLEYDDHKDIKRCTRCILPETMPFIKFDSNGVCNYCNNYKTRNNPKPKDEIFEIVNPYRSNIKQDCIVPFSGGRDSCYGLHLVVNELKMKPITYTYDWGMVTDLGRRNISRMCSKLGVENIIVAADISKKRENIRKNLKAWLKKPNLGMISILTAGDKHFFKYIESIKEETGIKLNLWGVNPLEVTHFKAGFLGVAPDFESQKVYTTGFEKQLNYQKLRFKAMLESPSYFNASLWDTLSGEYYRSFAKKNDYYHIFDYWRWDENIIDETLQKEYDWELAPDTSTTWRIGDGTAAFYNYIYYTVAGFTEHDTFRSNQIREGELTREKALELVREENKPRYQNIKWYLDVLDMDFIEVIGVINNIPKLYSKE